MSEMMSLRYEDFPALYRAADAASIGTRSRFMGRMRVDLVLLVVGGFISAVTWSSEGAHAVANILSGSLLIASMALTIIVKVQKDEGQWYEARAIAESAKSLAWQYMAGAPPFGRQVKADEADKLLVERLRALVTGRKGMFKELAQHAGQGEGEASQISNRMRDVRKASLETRKALYLKQRVNDQSRWYNSSSSRNGAAAVQWLYVVAGAQFLAGVAALVSARWVNMGGIVASISALAAASISWSQLNRFDDLAESYGVAAQDLTMIEAVSKHVSDEAGFGQFVQDAETAISREHTLWVARRGAA